ncbi:MAG: LOG family protein [Chitinophagales bacterium]|nr:LOG family protein [Chitinophagales bacterium]
MNKVTVAFFGSSDSEYNKDVEIIFQCLFDVFDKVVIINGGYQGTMNSVSLIGKKIAAEKNKEIFIQGVLFDGYKNDPDQSGVNMPNKISDVRISSNSIGDRVQSMIELADIVIALPGRTGTMHEIFQTIETIQYGMDYSELDKNFQRILIHKRWEKSIHNLHDNGNMSKKVYDNIVKSFFSFGSKKERKIEAFKNKLTAIKQLELKKTSINNPDIIIPVQDFTTGEQLDKSHKITKIALKLNEILAGNYIDEKCNNIVGLDIALKEKSKKTEKLFRLDTVGNLPYIIALHTFLQEYESIIGNSEEPDKKWEDIECVCAQADKTLLYTNHIEDGNMSEFKGEESADIDTWIAFLKEKKLGKTVYWSSVSLSGQYYISVFLLLDVFVPSVKKEEIERVLNQYLLEDAVTKIADRSKENITQYAKNAAIAQVLARTTSHNTGSHILSNNLAQYVENPLNDFKYELIQKEKSGKSCSDILNEFESKPSNPNTKRPLEEFRIYLRQRMLFNADITSSSSKSYSAVKLIDVLNAFKNLEIVRNHISGLENCLFGGFKHSNSKEIENIVISLPNGILGYHALYIVFENLIRNYFKHSNGSGMNLTPVGEKKWLYIDLNLFHGMTNDFYYSIDISDGSQINEVTHNRISTLISEPILNNGNELRSEGLGYLEIKAALSYINNIPLSEIDNPCLTDFKKDEQSVSVFSIQSLDDSSLWYRIFLPKPFVIKTSNSNELNKTLLTKGIVDCKSITPFDSRCEFYFGESPIHSASVTPRIAATMQTEQADDFIRSYYDASLAPVKNSVAIYRIKTDKTNGSLVKEKLSLSDNTYQLTPDTNQSPEWSIFLDDHTKRMDYVFQNKESLGNFFYEGYSGQSRIGQIMNDIGKVKDEPFLIQKITEAYFTKVIVIDERIQRYAEQKYPHSTLSVPIFDILQMSGVSVPDKSLSNLDLNNPTIDKDMFRTSLKTYLEHEIKDCKLKPFVLIHLGIIEKLTENKSSASISEQIKLIKPENLPDDSVVLISERGTPKNVEQQYRFMHYSNVAKSLVEEQSKLSLTNAVFASRCLINQ